MLPLFVLDPALWGPAGPSRRAYLGASLRALERRCATGGRCAACGGAGRPGQARGRGRPGGRRRAGARRRRLRPLRRAARRARSSRRWPTHGVELVAHRVAVRRGAGAGDRTDAGDAVPGLHAVPQALGRARLARPVDAAARTSPGSTVDGHHGPPRPAAARRARPARGRRGRGAAPVAGVPRRPARRLRRATATSPGVRRHLADVGAPQVGRDPPAHDARRPRRRAARPAPRPTATSWPGGSSTPTCCTAAPRPPATTSAREYARMAYDEPGDPLDAVAARAHRLPDRRRRDAPAAGDRLDAQPGPHDHRQLPGQGPARRVAARRPALHAAGSSTATSPPTSTAGSGSPAPAPTPRRTSGSSTRPRRAGSSTPTAPTSGGGCPSSPTSPTRTTPHEHAGGPGYPAPVVDHAEERREALERWERIRR